MCREDERYAKLKPLPVPKPFGWLFEHFKMIYKHGSHDMWGNKILQPIDVINYCECFKVVLTIEERKLIFLMKDWVSEVISELNNNDKE